MKVKVTRLWLCRFDYKTHKLISYLQNSFLRRYILKTLFTVVMLSTAISWTYPSLLPSIGKNFDAIENTRKLFQESRDEDAKRLAFINGTRFFYFIINVTCHIGFTSSITTPVTHGKTSNFWWLLIKLAFNLLPSWIGKYSNNIEQITVWYCRECWYFCRHEFYLWVEIILL